MDRSIILAALIVGAAILLNGQLEKISRFRPHSSLPVKAGSAAGGKSVAVLPFQDLGGDLQNSQSVDGLREEIVAELTKLTELIVADLERGRSGKAPIPAHVNWVANLMSRTSFEALSSGRVTV